MGHNLRDAQWVRQAFMVKGSELEKVDLQNRFFSPASLKFTDTMPGGSLCINPTPQFTRLADPPVIGKLTGSPGLGRYYSEAFDTNSQIISMRFGVPQFNSMTSFFTSFYNTGAGHLVRTGRATGAFYSLGKAAGFIVSIMSWKLLAVHLLGVGGRFLLQKPSSKYYFLKPAMPLYWSAVQTIVNQVAVNTGIIPRIGGEGQNKINNEYEFGNFGLKQMHQALPSVFREGGGIDVYAIANRAQRLMRRRAKLFEEAANSAENMSLQERMDDYSKVVAGVYDTRLSDPGATYDGYMDKWLATQYSQPVDGEDGNGVEKTSENSKDESWFANLGEFLGAELDDGGAFASFRVNYTGPVSESFSNSVGESEIAQKINGMSSSARSFNFNFMGGNVDDGVVGKAIGSIVGAAKDFAAGVLDSVQLSGLAMLGGAALVDIPKQWQSSMASLPRMSYTINLVSPYGNPLSRLLNLYLPLGMLLAGALPLSTGKQSYSHPFLCELFDQGRCQTRLGMIDSLSVTRGVGNLGFNADNQALAIDVSFSVVDMSSIMHMPVSQGISLVNTISGIFDEDTIFSDYMAVLGGMSLNDQVYSIRKLKLNLTRSIANFQRWKSPAFYASFLGDTMPGRLASALYMGIDRGAR